MYKEKNCNTTKKKKESNNVLFSDPVCIKSKKKITKYRLEKMSNIYVLLKPKFFSTNQILISYNKKILTQVIKKIIIKREIQNTYNIFLKF